MTTNSINRRDFLKYSTTITATSLLFPYIASSQDSDIDCLVLGAGMAGITAARYLTDSNLKVKVLEGSGTTGGRISTYVGNSKGRNINIDLGGEFVHREKDKVPLWGEIRKHNLEYEVIPKRKEGYMYHPDMGGKELKKLTMAGMDFGPMKSLNIFRKIAQVKERDISALDFINSYEGSKKDFDFRSMVLSGHLPGGLENISVMGFNSDDIATQIRGEHDFHLRGGFDSILDILSKDLDIRTDEKVQRISYGDGIIVNTDSNEYKAKSAVCSFSIGMLQSGNVEFYPKLPEEKQDALHFIKPGHQSKIIMEFDERFWPEKASMFHRIDRERKSSGRSYFNLHYNEANTPPMLTALFVGDNAKDLRSKNTERAVRDICHDLDAMFPHAAPTYKHLARGDEAIPIIRKEWWDDPFSKGGISFLKIDEEKSVDVQLARTKLANSRTTPGLFWAGEACTIGTQPTSTHGAHASGLRASEEVMHYLTTKESLDPMVSSKIVIDRYEDSLPKKPRKRPGR